MAGGGYIASPPLISANAGDVLFIGDIAAARRGGSVVRRSIHANVRTAAVASSGRSPAEPGRAETGARRAACRTMKSEDATDTVGERATETLRTSVRRVSAQVTASEPTWHCERAMHAV